MVKKARQNSVVGALSNTGIDHNPNFNYDSFKRQAIAQLYAGKGFSGKDGVFGGMMKDILETALGEELNHHLRREREEFIEGSGDLGRGSDSSFNNRKNGYNSKLVKSKDSAFSLDVGRDRNGSFEPQIIRKNQTILTPELDDKIIALYGLGMSYRDIVAHMEEMYGIEISKSLITSITDKIIPKIKEWQNRPLESVYPIIFLDAIHFKCTEESKVISKAFYSVLGINCEGKKDILGLYISENEGANFWLSVLTDLHNRGVQDILICCVDGLKGLPEAIAAIFPKTEVQLCVIHQIRNSLKYIASKDQKEFMSDLKLVYKANSKDLAESELENLEAKWGKKYALVIKSWNNNWHNLSAYFRYSGEIRRMIYTTNIVEGFHRQVRKVTKTKGSFTSQTALEKLIFLTIKNISKKWVMPVQNWSLIVGQLDIFFAGRLKLDLA